MPAIAGVDRQAPRWMSMWRLRSVRTWILIVGLVFLAAVAFLLRPLALGPSLPPGATELRIATDAPGVTAGCATALLLPARLTAMDDDLVLVTVATGEIVRVVWPAGFAAWRLDGAAILADPWGSVVGREGDVLDSLGGGTDADGVFHICPYGIVTQR